MIGTVARKEYLALRRDARVRLTAIMLLLMLLVAFASAAARYTSVSQERDAAQALINEQWDTQGEKNPHAAAHYGLYAIRSVTPLSFFDTGVTSYSGVSIWLEAHRRNRPAGMPAADNAAATGVAELTAAYTLQILLPLFVILLAFPAFAAEREQGTLRQVLGTGVTPQALLIGKAVGIAGAVMTVVGPILLLGLFALMLTPGGIASLPQAIALIATYLLYAIVVLFVSLAVSARAATAQAALVALLAFWAVTSFVLPRLAADFAALRHDLPHAIDFDAAIEADRSAGLDGRTPADVIEQRRRQTLDLYGADSTDELPINFQGIVFSVTEQLDAAVFESHYSDLDSRLLSQQAVYGMASVVSPRIAVELASMQWSGTGLAQYLDFGNHAESFRLDFIEALNRDLTMNSAPGQTDYRSGPELWETTGDYRYPEPTFGSALVNAAPYLLVLALWLAASIVYAWLGVRRIRVSI